MIDPKLRAIYYVALCNGASSDYIDDPEADSIILDAQRHTNLMKTFLNERDKCVMDIRTQITLDELMRMLSKE